MSPRPRKAYTYKRRLWAAFFALLLALSPVFSPTLAAEEPDISVYPESAVYLAEASSPLESVGGMEKNADEKAYPASITKLLTALVAVEQGNLSDLVTVSDYAVDLSRTNAKIGALEGDVFTLEDLLYGMLLPSGCDAARAIAEHIGKSEAGFAVLMNKKAAELGMTHSHFTNASGLHDDELYTTARDLALLGAAVSENETLLQILSVTNYTLTEKTTGRSIEVKSINRLLCDAKPGEYEKVSALYEWNIGGKTGSTNAAGRTFLCLARKDGLTLVCVLLGDKVSTANTKESAYDAIIANRFLEARELFIYGFSYLTPSVKISELIEQGLPYRFSAPLLEDGDARTIPCVLKDTEQTVSLYLPKLLVFQQGGEISYTLNDAPFALPVREGDSAGTVTFTVNGEDFLTLELCFERSLSTLPPATATPAVAVLTATPNPTAASPSPGASPIGALESESPLSIWLFLPLILLFIGTFLWIFIKLRRKKSHR